MPMHAVMPIGTRHSALAAAVLALAIPAAPAHAKPISKPKTIRVQITEYYSPPERAFDGRKVKAPGLGTKHRVDFLYSAKGIAMEGDGVASGGRHIHLCDGFGLGYLTVGGRRWNMRSNTPSWLAAYYWKNRRGRITYPLDAGGWSDGRGVRFRGPRGTRFCRGSSRDIRPYATAAVDPRLIPLGSRLKVSYYQRNGKSRSGWFKATDTGGAIKRRHIDVYRPYPTADDPARNLRSVRIRVIPPKR